MVSDVAAILNGDKWFDGLAEDRKALLLQAGRMIDLPAGKLIYANGAATDGLWAVIEGQVRLTGLPANGNEILVRILKPGSWFGELSTLDGQPRPQEAVAFGASTLFHIKQGTFERLAQQDPLFYRDLALLICINQRRALAFISLGLSSVRVRLIRALLSAIKAAGVKVIKIKQIQLAAIVGVSRQTINKELKQLEKLALIDCRYAMIEVIDQARLAMLADKAND